MACESWDLTFRGMIPERTYFYRVLPLGLGSAYVESLTGYIARIAEAHSVSTGMLVRCELLPRIRAAFPTQAVMPARDSTFIYESHVLNGTGDTARSWVQLLQRLTGVDSLDGLTLLAWGQVISNQSLIRQVRAWCPSCYENWSRSDLPIYEPLLWTIGAVSYCPLHRRPLRENCPHCQGTQHPLSARLLPGYCGRCRGWLGDDAGLSATTDEVNRGVATAEGIGELLLAASRMASLPSRDHLRRNLQVAVDTLADGSKSRFCRATGTSFGSVSCWLSASGRIQIDDLVNLSVQLTVSPLRLLSERVPVNSFENAREIFSNCARKRRVESIPLRPAVRQSSRGSMAALLPPRELIKNAFAEALDQPAPCSVRSIAWKLGYRYETSLYRRFPELAHALVIHNARLKERRTKELRDPLAAALRETPPPTIPEMARRLGWTVMALRYRFPSFCSALVARIPERKRFFADRVRVILDAALREEPAPSTDVVAKRAGRSADYLRTIHGDLWRQVAARRTEWKTDEGAKRRTEFQDQIHGAVIELCRQGVTPSRQRVFASISNPVMKSSYILGRQIAATLGKVNR